jgi:DTW domain-containing protein YfiP
VTPRGRRHHDEQPSVSACNAAMRRGIEWSTLWPKMTETTKQRGGEASKSKGARGMRGARCITCRSRLTTCMCDVLPHLNPPSPFHFVVDAEEERRTTNTGWLARTALGATWTVGRPKTTPAGALLLFPGAARQLSPADAGSPIIVVDGTWRRAKAHARSFPLLALPLVSLPTDAPSAYPLRQGRREGRLCTLEAVARSLRALGSDADARALEELLRVFVERTIQLREGRGPMLSDVLS